MQLEVPSHKAKKISGITRKYTSEFSLPALGFNILALITFNTDTVQTSKDLKRRGEKEGSFFSGEILNCQDQKRPHVGSAAAVFSCHPSQGLGSNMHWPNHPLPLSVPQFTHLTLHWSICSVGVLIIMLNMLCVWVELL